MVTGLHFRPAAAEALGVDLTQCPYDGTPIEAEAYSGGSVLLDCPCCGAAWEWHNALVRRVREPDRERVVTARTSAGADSTETAAVSPG